MGFLVLLDLVTSAIQFFVMVGNTKVPWPPFWQDAKDLLSLSLLDFDRFARIVSLPNDWRSLYTVVTTGIPLATAFLVLLFFQPVLTVVWYFFFAFSISIILGGIAGIVFSFISSLELITRQECGVFIVFGLMIFYACVCLFSIKRAAVTKKNHDPSFRFHIKSKGKTAHQQWSELPYSAKEIKVLPFLLKLSLFLSLMVFGAFLLGAIPSTGIDAILSRANVFGSLARVVGMVIFSLSLIVLLWLFIGVPEKGRYLKWRVKSTLTLNFLKMLILVVSIVYIPVVVNVLNAFNCSSQNCQLGTRFPDDTGTRTTDRPRSIKESKCEHCNWVVDANGETCPSALAQELCPNKNDLRLVSNNSIRCWDIAPFFWTACMFSIASSVIGIPYMFHTLIKTTAKHIEGWKLPPHVKAAHSLNTSEAIWSYKIAHAQALSRSLYQPFTCRMKFWRLATIVHKLLIVVASTLLIHVDSLVSSTTVVVIVMLVIHAAFLGIHIRFSPFISPAEDRVSAAICFIMTLNSFAALLLVTKAISATNDIVWWFLVVLLCANLLVPILAFVLTILLLRDRKKVVADTTYQQSSDSEMEESKYEGDRGNNEGPGSPLRDEGENGHNNTCDTERTEDNCREETNAKQLHDDIVEVASKINNDSMKALVRFFLGSGILSFVAFTMCLIGIFFKASFNYYIPATPIRTGIETALVGYRTWGDFADNCCCMDGSSTNLNYDTAVYSHHPNVTSTKTELEVGVVEKWICKKPGSSSQLVVERLRSRDGGKQHGFNVRAFCSRKFNPSCALVTKTEDGVFRAECSLSGTVENELW